MACSSPAGGSGGAEMSQVPQARGHSRVMGKGILGQQPTLSAHTPPIFQK